MEYFPTAEDLTEDLAVIAVDKDLSGASGRLQVARNRLQRLIDTDPDAIDLIRAARAEFEVFGQLRALILLPDALDTLEAAMRGNIDGKKAMAAVRAAESILDRTSLPKISRQDLPDPDRGKTRALPDMNALLEKAENDEKAREVADQYRELLRQMDAVRRGAKEVIEGEANVTSPPS